MEPITYHTIVSCMRCIIIEYNNHTSMLQSNCCMPYVQLMMISYSTTLPPRVSQLMHSLLILSK